MLLVGPFLVHELRQVQCEQQLRDYQPQVEREPFFEPRPLLAPLQQLRKRRP